MEKGIAMDRHKGDKHGYTETWTDTKVANMDTQTWTDTKVTKTWIHRDMDTDTKVTQTWIHNNLHKGDLHIWIHRDTDRHKGDTDMDTQ